MRKTLARLGMGVAATAAALAFAAPAAHATGDRDVEDGGSASAQAPSPGSILDGWCKRTDTSFGFAMAVGVSDLMDVWANRDLDIDAFGSAMAKEFSSRLDGWANRDLDIDAFASAMIQQFGPWAQAHDKSDPVTGCSSSDAHDRGALPITGRAPYCRDAESPPDP